MTFTLIQIAKKFEPFIPTFFGCGFRKRFVTNSMIYFKNHQKLKQFCSNLEKTPYLYMWLK
jgi:hypothetical protein